MMMDMTSENHHDDFVAVSSGCFWGRLEWKSGEEQGEDEEEN